MSEELFDVLAVNIETSKVRFLAQGKTLRNAGVIVEMAIARRGVYDEIYVEVPAGKYKDGDEYISE